MDLYAILGVDKDAAKEAVKLAHRKLVMEHHPDQGGDPEKFQQVDIAYKILRDPERRKAYDETGKVDMTQVLSEAEMMHKVITDVYTQLLNSGDALDGRHSVVDLMKKIIDANLEAMRNRVVELKDNLETLEEVKGTITREGEGENLFVQITDNRIDLLNRELGATEKNVSIGGMVLEELALYKSFARVVDTFQERAAYSSFFNTGSTSTW